MGALVHSKYWNLHYYRSLLLTMWWKLSTYVILSMVRSKDAFTTTLGRYLHHSPRLWTYQLCFCMTYLVQILFDVRWCVWAPTRRLCLTTSQVNESQVLNPKLQLPHTFDHIQVGFSHISTLTYFYTRFSCIHQF